MRKDKQFILNLASIIGVCLTMASTINDTTKACKLIDDDMTLKEKVKTSWKCYIPSGIIVTSTILCIIYSDTIVINEKIALLSALTASQNRYKDIRESIDDVCDDKTKEEIFKKNVREKVPTDVYIDRTDVKLFYEEYTGEFFYATIQDVLEAECLFNKQLSIVGYAILNDFYDILGLPKTNTGKYLGWCTDDKFSETAAISPWVDFEHSMMTDDSGCEYYYLNYSNQPIVQPMGYGM